MREAAQSRRAIGNLGEALACDYLVSQGYTVLCQNYTTAHGEIDIIVKKEDVIAFVEVKSRTGFAQAKRFGRPARAVDASKWEHIFFAAKQYLKENHVLEKPRLDVIEVYLDPADRHRAQRINYYPGAYRV